MPVRSTPLQHPPPEPGQVVPTADPRDALTKWAEVDSRALSDNVRAIGDHVGAGVGVMAMVKANGYGHGMLTASRAALAGGAAWLGVSCAEEAQALRQAGIDAPVLITGWCQPRLAAELITAGVDLTVYDADTLEAVIAGARLAGRTASVHLKVDTGMTRLGARADSVPALCASLAAARREVVLRGVFTHFAVAEADDAFTAEQNDGLLRAVDCARQIAPDALLHAANSAAALTSPHTWHDLVRAGIAIYGYPPVATAVPLRLAMTVVARVTQVRTVSRGDSVGYGRTWRAQRPTRVATVAAGYADGVMRSLSNRGVALIGGQRAPIVGRVSMDQITLDVSDIDNVRSGDAAVLFGVRDGATLDAAAVAEMAGTIANDVLCAVSSRVPRIDVGATGG
jgi:alanine racemase